jgi:protein-disulfide isomerase
MLLKNLRVLWTTTFAAGILWLWVPPSLGAESLVVATIGKQEITSQDLEARTATKVNAEQREYELRIRQLSLSHERGRREYEEHELAALVDERVLALEAKARRTTPEALMLAGSHAPETTDAQVQAFYDSQRTQINQPFELVAPKIRAYLQKGATEAARRQYLAVLRTKYHAQITLEPLRTQVVGYGPERGPADAPVTIVEFSDFQCPFCGRFEPVVSQVMAEYPRQVRLIYRNYPLTTMHPDAQKAAEGAQCARDQGKFWEMHDLLFAEQTSLSVDALKEKARRLGLDTTAFNDCLDSGKARETIAADVRVGDELGITGTPASFVNGRFAGGAVTESELKDLIDDELHRAGASPPPSASLAQ